MKLFDISGKSYEVATNVEIETTEISEYGLSTKIYFYGKIVTFKIWGTLSKDLPVASDYVSLGTVDKITNIKSDTTAIIKRIIPVNGYNLQLNISKVTGDVKLGYGKLMSDGKDTAIPKNNSIYIQETIFF